MILITDGQISNTNLLQVLSIFLTHSRKNTSNHPLVLKVKCKVQLLTIMLLTRDGLKTRRTLRSRKSQLIGMS